MLFVDLFLQYTPSDAAITEKEIKWFWEVVNDLKENEKALLLKFSTGSPCVPAGGFSQLQVPRTKTSIEKWARNEQPSKQRFYGDFLQSNFDDILYFL